jgi:hypothetical protein
MATLTGKLVSETYKALLKMIDNDILTESEKQISDGYGQGTGIFIDDNGFIRASVFKVTGGSSSQFLKADGSLDSNSYLTAASAANLFLPIGSTTTVIPEGTNLYFTNARVLSTPLTGFVATTGTVTAADTVLTSIEKIWWNIVNGGGGGGGYIPYTGATQSLNMGEWGITSGFYGFDLTPTGTPTTVGTMSWNSQDGTADLKMGGGNVTLQIGQEELVRVVNKTGANLLEANYQAVRVSGAQGNRLKVALAKADNDANSADTIGLVTETINNNQEGFVTAVGLVRNIDTTGDLQTETWADGEMLYLSSTTAGAITNIKPEAPEHGVRLGYVVRAHKTQGQIYVKVDNGYELDELHNVLITDPITQDILTYDEGLTGGLWINRNIWTAIGATEVGKSLLAILDAEDTTPVTTKPRAIRINVDNTVDALEVGTQGYLPFYDDTDFYIDSPVFTDGTDVVIGGETPNGTNKLTVIGGIWGEELVLNDQFLLATNPIGGNYSFNIYDGTSWITQMVLSKTNLVFNISGYEKMRLNASGYLGLGTDTPTALIHAKSTVAYPKIIIDNASASGGGMFSAYQNGTEIANFGVSGAWLIDNSSDVAIVATKAGQGIQFFTNGSNSQKMAINDEGNVYIGQSPTFVAGATQLIVRGKTGAGFLGVQHYDMSIKGSINTFNSVFQVGTSTFHSVAVIVEDTERARFNSGGRFLLGTTTDNTTDIFQANGSIIASAIKKSGGTSAQFLKADGSVDSTAYGTGSVTSVSATVPTGFAISGSPITTSGTLAITFASGYALPTTIKQSNWDDAYTWVAAFPTQTGNAGKYLTTDGSTLSWGTIVAGVSSFNTRTGAITLSSTDVTNALGFTPVTNARTITINGTTKDLSTNITFTTGGVTSFNTRDGAVTLSNTDVTTALGFTPVTQARTLTINGQGYDLSADRSWTITPSSGMRNVTQYIATAGQTTFTITGGYTAGLIDIFLNGVRIPESDFTATNGTTVVFTTGVKVDDVVTAVLYTASATSGITGAGTANYLAKWSGTSAITNSIIFDDGTNVGIGTASPTFKLDIVGTTRIAGNVSGGFVGLTIKNNSTGTNASQISMQTNTQDWFLNVRTDNHFGIYNNTAATSPFVITTGGNVGIGTTSPSSILHLNSASSNGTVIRLTSTSTNGKTYGIGSNFVSGAGEFAIYDYTAGAQRFFINSSGNIGIGTTTPSEKLSVLGNINIATDGNSFQWDASGNKVALNAYSGNLVFYTGTAGYNERMRITSSGFVGINTSNPGVYLDVQGGTINAFTAAIMANSTFTFGSTNGKRLVVLSSTQGDKNGLQIGYDSTDGTGIIAASTESAGAGLDFYTYNGSWASRVRIAKSGSLGIGTTNPRTYLHSATSASSGVLPSLGAIGDATALYLTNSNSLYGMLMGSLPSGNSWIQVQRTDGNATAYNLILQPNGGSVSVTGSLSKGSGSFRIDHPLKPKTHQLVHSFIEGPQADLIYRGKLNLVNGKGMANIDDVSSMTKGTFEALCRDVQCFTTNENGWDLVKGKVIGNIIYIESVNPNSTDEISWMVIGERKDKHMFDTEWTDEYGKVIVEPLKEIFNA